MSIRNASKVIIIEEGKLLLIQYINKKGERYYELPGGGQLQYETMEEAAIRECLEETGLPIQLIRLAAIAEEIFDSIELRCSYPEYAHRIHHIFIGELAEKEVIKPTECDFQQADTLWIPISELSNQRLLPRMLMDNLNRILQAEHPIHLGTVHEDGP